MEQHAGLEFTTAAREPAGDPAHAPIADMDRAEVVVEVVVGETDALRVWVTLKW